MRYGSVCSGIEAATVAWHPLGWEAAWFSEIEPFPSAVLAHHYPDVPNLGDMTAIHDKPEFNDGSIDLLVGGTPCQSFSVAGLRKGLDDPRGNLALVFLAIAERARARWLVWENVPGVLSSNGGRDFGAFLGALVELGYGFAYRVLDAQYFGVAQRRRRVFVVAHLGDWRRAAAVLFEPEGLRGYPAPSREAGQAAPTIPSRSSAGGGFGTDFECDGGLIQAYGGNRQSGPLDVATAVTAHGGPYGRMDFESETFIAHTLRSGGFDASEDGTGRGNPLVPVAFTCSEQANSFAWEKPYCGALTAKTQSETSNIQQVVRIGNQVRRLTPREWERLQGLPDDYTLIPYRGKPAKDGPRYKALGNSMAMPVMRWIGERIAAVEALS